LAADPFREAIHRDLLILLLLNGQPGEALRQQARWSANLQEELGISPMPQTMRVVDEIRSGKIFDRLDTLRTQYFLQPKLGKQPEIANSSPRLATSGARATPGIAPELQQSERRIEAAAAVRS
jgi:DNA-binding SARP family transcriptional activator